MLNQANLCQFEPDAGIPRGTYMLDLAMFRQGEAGSDTVGEGTVDQEAKGSNPFTRLKLQELEPSVSFYISFFEGFLGAGMG